MSDGGDESSPDTALVIELELVARQLPGVPVPHYGNGMGIWRPDSELSAIDRPDRGRMRSHCLIGAPWRNAVEANSGFLGGQGFWHGLGRNDQRTVTPLPSHDT